MRLFVAIELPVGLRETLRQVQESLRQASLPVRWVRPEGIHLTLKFLGEAAETRLGEIMETLEPAGRGVAPFRLEACGAVPFPDRGAPRLIWVEVRGDVDSLRRLAAAVDAATGRIGFPTERREFRAHLTLGRVRGPGRGGWRAMMERVSERLSGPFEVRDYVLFQSRLGPGGSAYVPLRRFRLGRDAADGSSEGIEP